MFVFFRTQERQTQQQQKVTLKPIVKSLIVLTEAMKHLLIKMLNLIFKSLPLQNCNEKKRNEKEIRKSPPLLQEL